VKKLFVPFIETSNASLVADFTKGLANLVPQQIAHNPWPIYTHAVEASFVIGHNGDTICLKYTVCEPHIKANANFNEEMHLDSCVELFIAFDDDKGDYYNLEFNCLGYAKVAYGSGRGSRTLLPVPLIVSISSFAKIDSLFIEGRKRFQWELLLLIPKTVFSHTRLSSLRGKNTKANFYKCGDGLSAPHFLTWNRIVCPEPDFHRPEFFGSLAFG